MKVRAPAKVNLQLKIHGRRPDSFHDIETLIIPLSLADELTVEISAGARIDVQCDDPDVPEGRSNLAATAAHEFAQFIGRQFGVDIRIRKRIPMRRLGWRKQQRGCSPSGVGCHARDPSCR